MNDQFAIYIQGSRRQCETVFSPDIQTKRDANLKMNNEKKSLRLIDPSAHSCIHM